MIVKVPDAIDEAQSGTCFLLHRASGLRRACRQPDRHSVRRRSQIRAVRLYCAVHTDAPRISRPTVSLLCCALYVL